IEVAGYCFTMNRKLYSHIQYCEVKIRTYFSAPTFFSPVQNLLIALLRSYEEKVENPPKLKRLHPQPQWLFAFFHGTLLRSMSHVAHKVLVHLVLFPNNPA